MIDYDVVCVCDLQALQQEKHVLQRKLDMNELSSNQRETELTSDLTALRAELERSRSQGRDLRRNESEQLSQLANHNQRLVEQLAEVRGGGLWGGRWWGGSSHSGVTKKLLPI